MSRETLEALYDAFGRGDMEPVAATYADEASRPDEVSYSGIHAYYDFWSGRG